MFVPLLLFFLFCCFPPSGILFPGSPYLNSTYNIYNTLLLLLFHPLRALLDTGCSYYTPEERCLLLTFCSFVCEWIFFPFILQGDGWGTRYPVGVVRLLELWAQHIREVTGHGSVVVFSGIVVIRFDLGNGGSTSSGKRFSEMIAIVRLWLIG